MTNEQYMQQCMMLDYQYDNGNIDASTYDILTQNVTDMYVTAQKLHVLTRRYQNVTSTITTIHPLDRL